MQENCLVPVLFMMHFLPGDPRQAAVSTLSEGGVLLIQPGQWLSAQLRGGEAETERCGDWHSSGGGRVASGGLQEGLWRREACRPTRLLHTHTIKNNIYIHTTTQLILVLVSSLLNFTIHHLYTSLSLFIATTIYSHKRSYMWWETLIGPRLISSSAWWVYRGRWQKVEKESVIRLHTLWPLEASLRDDKCLYRVFHILRTKLYICVLVYIIIKRGLLK